MAALIRRLARAPFAASINVLTLALGLTCFITAHAVAEFWQRSDRHFANVERIFAVSTDLRFDDGSLATGEMPLTNEHVARYLAADYPQLAAVARASVLGDHAMVATEERAARLYRVAVDPEFGEIFDLPFIAGDAATALKKPRSVVLTRQAAERLFGDQDPIGRPVLLSNSIWATVTGVIASIPEPSHMGRSASASLRFDLLSTFDLSEAPAAATPPPENWLLLNTTTYVLLPSPAVLSATDLRLGLERFANRHVPAEQLVFADLEFGLVPVTELLVRAGTTGVLASRTGLTATSALLLLGALVLAVACINYANLATARAAEHSRDVGVRKLFGAKRRQIATLYWLEAGLLTATASAIALGFVFLIVPAVSAATGIDLRITLLDGPASATFLVVLLLLVTVVAGAYPAFVLSRLPPVSMLRPRKGPAASHGLWTLLLGAQFAVASFLSIAAVVAYQQNAALRQAALRQGEDPVVIIENFYTVTGLHPDTLKDALLGMPQVSVVTSMARAPWGGVNVLPVSMSPAETAGASTALWHTVGYDFFATFDIAVIAGRVFLRDRGEDALPFLHDANRPNNIVIGRSLLRELRFGSPEEAVDQLVYVPKSLLIGFGGSAAQPLRIIGVVEDKPLTLIAVGPRSSVYSFAEPLPFQAVQIRRDQVADALAAIDALWRRLLPNVALHRRLTEDLFAEKHRNFERLYRSFAALAVFAFVIAAVGLFAMAAVLTSRRRYEIAVRKALGASSKRVALMLLASFAKPVIAGAAVAWPIAYVGARAYLEAFVEPIALTPAPFVVSLAATLLIVAGTVGAQTLRAAYARPHVALRQS